jgi:hypothetical protein
MEDLRVPSVGAKNGFKKWGVVHPFSWPIPQSSNIKKFKKNGNNLTEGRG